ncbi:MAG: AAA family ATPase [Pseudomonadota bacterium]
MHQVMTVSECLRAASSLPNGARFYRCALQVNPFAYLSRHNKQISFQNEADYNAAIITTCQEQDIEVIGVTDHYQVHESTGLLKAARDAGLFAFSGFEAVTKDGVHILCLFNPDKDDVLVRYIGECGVSDQKEASPLGNFDCLELLHRAREWGSICIAAHVAWDGGLLRKLSGQTRIKTWKSDDLLACALPGPISEAPEDPWPILQNKDAQHRRERPVAVINASDVNSPDDLRKDGSNCFIKMSEVSVEALRQAFLDPISRIRLNSSDGPAAPHAEFLAMTWEGGFLRDTAIHFNENLNVLVGGRGTGKSTIVESLRYVLGLDPLGEDARKAHEGIIRHVLRSGTKISLLVRSHRPSPCSYTVERTVPNPPVVKDETGTILTLSPKDVMPGVEVFGQHEISELTKSPEKLTLLLERFIDRDPSLARQKSKLRLELERSRSRIGDVKREIRAIDERMAALPRLEETLKRFQEAGIEDRLREKSLLIREERLLAIITERLAPIQALNQELAGSFPIDTAFLTPKALEDLPNADVLSEAEGIFGRLNGQIQAIADQLDSALKSADAEFAGMRQRWEERRNAVEETYEKLLRELQKSKIDGEEFIRLRQRIEELRPLRERRESLLRDLDTHDKHRRQLLVDWEDVKAAEYRGIERAATKVSKKLGGRVRVEVTMAGNREPLERLLRDAVGGNLTAALERLRERTDLSLPDFAMCCREGKEALTQHYALPPGAAERIAGSDAELFMRIEELELTATTRIELNTASEGQPATWQSLGELSTGQKATAVLLLLLLESEAPLVVDQPEDDLDNRFITEGVVPSMREEKRRRQFVFSTHNANIPVLGDAELILGLGASGEAKDKEGQAMIEPTHMGSIDSLPVRELVEEILEGGKTAFEMRRLKYGF